MPPWKFEFSRLNFPDKQFTSTLLLLLLPYDLNFCGPFNFYQGAESRSTKWFSYFCTSGEINLLRQMILNFGKICSIYVLSENFRDTQSSVLVHAAGKCRLCKWAIINFSGVHNYVTAVTEQFLKGPTYLISICEIGITYCVVVHPYEMPPFFQKIGLHSLFLGCCECKYYLVVCKTPYSPTTTMVFLVFSDAALLR